MRQIKCFKMSELPKEYVEELLEEPPDMNTNGRYWHVYAGSFVEEVEENGWEDYFTNPNKIEKYKEADKIFFAAGAIRGEQILVEQG